MRDHPVPRVLADVVAWTLASFAGATGCGPGQARPPARAPDSPPMVQPTASAELPAEAHPLGSRGIRICGDGQPIHIQQLHLERPVDSLELRGRAPGEERLHACMLHGCNYFVYQHGSEVGQIDALPYLMTVLGPIDTPYEAEIIAWANGFDIDCAKLPRALTEGGKSGYEVSGTQRKDGCPDRLLDYLLRVDRDGTVVVVASKPRPGYLGACVGRRPPGWIPRASRRPESVGEHFARAAELEADSIDAFRILHRDLAHHGAPTTLLDDARRAAGDEVRHAEMTTRLARRYGAAPRSPRVAARAPRSLLEVAIENEREGCVRETFGGAVGLWQAARARDPIIAETMRSLAADEVRHAALAWSIGSWAACQLSVREQRDLRHARHEAITDLRREMSNDPGADLIEAAGLPTPAEAISLLTQIGQRLWLDRG